MVNGDKVVTCAFCSPVYEFARTKREWFRMVGKSQRAHHFKTSSTIDGGHAVALPTLAACELICFARKRNFVQQPATRWHDGQITSDFQKSCQAQESKIFCFRSHANQSHNSARLTADEGRWPSSRTRGEMRWTRELRLTCAAQTYGEVVWFGRRGAGAKSKRSEASRGRRRQKSRSPGRARSKP